MERDRLLITLFAIIILSSLVLSNVVYLQTATPNASGIYKITSKNRYHYIDEVTVGKLKILLDDFKQTPAEGVAYFSIYWDDGEGEIKLNCELAGTQLKARDNGNDENNPIFYCRNGETVIFANNQWYKIGIKALSVLDIAHAGKNEVRFRVYTNLIGLEPGIGTGPRSSNETKIYNSLRRDREWLRISEIKDGKFYVKVNRIEEWPLDSGKYNVTYLLYWRGDEGEFRLECGSWEKDALPTRDEHKGEENEKKECPRMVWLEKDKKFYRFSIKTVAVFANKVYFRVYSDLVKNESKAILLANDKGAYLTIAIGDNVKFDWSNSEIFFKDNIRYELDLGTGKKITQNDVSWSTGNYTSTYEKEGTYTAKLKVWEQGKEAEAVEDEVKIYVLQRLQECTSIAECLANIDRVVVSCVFGENCPPFIVESS